MMPFFSLEIIKLIKNEYLLHVESSLKVKNTFFCYMQLGRNINLQNEIFNYFILLNYFNIKLYEEKEVSFKIQGD